MTVNRTFYSSARLSVGIAICLTAISYFLFWHSDIARPVIITRWLRLKVNKTSSCLDELLIAFGIHGALNLSAPTYARLSQPVPISKACSSSNYLLSVDASAGPSNFSKLELLSSANQAKVPMVLHNLLANFSQRNLELFMAGGSLLGSVRHFGYFPWDADIDVMILSHQKAKVRQLLVDLSAADEFKFIDTERINGHWQMGIFCQAIRNKAPRREYGTGKLYPEKECATIVDFFFGWPGKDKYKRQEHPRSFPTSDVYPLRLRPFGQYLIPAPRNPENFLAAVYGKDYESKCYFKYFNSKSFDCASLRSIYPFVTHLRLSYQDVVLQVDVLLHQSQMLSLFIPQHL